MKHVILAALALSSTPVAAQTITTTPKVTIGGCGTVAIPKAVTSDPKALTIQADCFERAETIAKGAKETRLERIKSLAPALPPIGMNAVPASYYGTERIWSNLAYRASEWMGVVGGLNQYGNPNTAGRMFIQAPNDVYAGKTTNITCTWQGKGVGFVNGSVPDRWVRSDTGTLSFAWKPAGPAGKHGGIWFDLAESDGTFRNLDCREAGVVSNGRLDQRYVNDMKLYKTIRFLDWSNANSNLPITWATRSVPSQQGKAQGGDQPIEDMIEIANAAGADAWFTIPWNADETYVRGLATLARDTLKGKLYVETGNEVWNWAFKVTSQAQTEGETAGLAGTGNKWDNTFLRYAQKTIEQNKIVTEVYKAQPKRLVRVASFQSGNTNAVSIFLRYPDAVNWVDAFADAPYFSVDELNKPVAVTDTQEQLFARLETARLKSIQNTTAIAQIAKKYGKLSLVYEGGQHIVSSDVNATADQEMQHSPLMEAAYTRYLKDLRAIHTGPIMMYNATGAYSKYGSWGHHEYTGQPSKDAPKWNAIEKAISAK